MSALIWLCGPSGVGKSTLATALGEGDARALAAFGLERPPRVYVGRALASDGAPLCALLADPAEPVVVKHQYHYGTVVRGAAALAQTRLHRLALLWCAPAVYLERWAAKYPQLVERAAGPPDVLAHWISSAWPHVLSLHAALVAGGGRAQVELYDVTGPALAIGPACVVGGCECPHVDAAALSATMLALRDPWAMPGPSAA